MAKEPANGYEDIRKQRVEDNRKRFEDLGLLKIAKSLSELKKTEKKAVRRSTKLKSENILWSEPRRSSRVRSQVFKLQNEVQSPQTIIPSSRRKNQKPSVPSYVARPLPEVKTPCSEAAARALKAAEKVQTSLTSGNPSCVKSMVRTHVYSCFWLGLPSKFCEDHLPMTKVHIVLEAEDGKKYDAVYIGSRTAVSGGWRAFALDYKLDAGDALVLELTQPWIFKVYIVRASCEKKKDTSIKPLTSH